MKKFGYMILSIVVVSILVSSSVLAQSKKAEANPAATKITSDAAQQLVVQKYPSAHVVSCNLETVNGNSVWTVRFTRTGANLAQKAMVDAQTGKVTR